MATKKTISYNADSIVSLSPHQHLLKRLSLTFGSETGNNKNPYSSQKGVAIREILDNSLDEIRAEHGSNMKLSFFKDGSIEVYDSGRGIPVDGSVDGEGRKVSGIYKSLGIIQSGGKFSADSDRFSSGLNGVGAASTAHCSRMFSVTVYRDNKCYQLFFKDGTPGFFDDDNDPDSNFTELTDYSELRVSKDTRPASEKKNYKTGTKIKLWLRDEVFQSEYPYDHQDLIARLKATAFLVPQLRAEVYNELNMIDDPDGGEPQPQSEVYHFDDGLNDLIALNQLDEPLIEVLRFNTEGKYTEKNVPVLKPDGKIVSEDLERRVPIEVAFSYGTKYDYSMHSFVNTIHTKLGGVHETAFERAMVAAFNERFSSMRGVLSKADELPIVEDFREGLTIVLSVQVSEPQFTSQSKEQLSGREVQKAVYDALLGEFQSWIKTPSNSDVLQVIAKKVTAASKNRQKAREQRDLARKRNELSSSSLPDKLIDCEEAGTEKAELYIAEGDSAVSSLKGARDGRINALLGIRGKIINAHKSGAKAVLANAEVQDIIKALGAGSGGSFDFDKMRYPGGIFIATDADPDGNNISVLLYALFWHLFRPVIEAGKFYKLETPLFVITTKEGRKSRKIYARDERERDKHVHVLDKNKIKWTITRLKGLGEVNADVLYETAINPKTRVITQVTVDDIEAALDSLDLILGNDTAPRKVWIEESTIDEELVLD
jgi:DNA gyrase subunit B